MNCIILRFTALTKKETNTLQGENTRYHTKKEVIIREYSFLPIRIFTYICQRLPMHDSYEILQIFSCHSNRLHHLHCDCLDGQDELFKL